MPQIIKEIRVLVPPLAVLLLAALLPYRSLQGNWLGFFLVVFVGCSVLMAALSFGQEFQQRTISLLLSQPVPRKKIWLQKTGLLGLFLLAAAFSAVLAVVRYDPQLFARDTQSFAAALDSIWPAFPCVSVIAFCTAPLFTLLFRSTLLGVVFSLLIPGGLMALNGLFCEYVLHNREATSLSAYIVLGVYAVIGLPLGYRVFMKLQAIDGTTMGREIELPQGIRKSCAVAMEVFWGRFKSPTATLIRKEFRLQQVTFFLAAIFCILAALGGLLYSGSKDPQHTTNLGEVLLTVDFSIYMALLPLLAGSLAMAEEKGWGVAEGQLMLPVPVLKQWAIKTTVALSTGLILGFFLPVSCLYFGRHWFGIAEDQSSFPQWGFAYSLGYLLILQLVIYAGSMSGTTVRSILVALGLLVIIGCAIAITEWAFYRYGGLREGLHYLFVASGQDVSYDGGQKANGKSGFFAPEVLVCFVLLQRFSFAGFRRVRPIPGMIGIQIAIIFLIACLINLTAVRR
jgi:hypothetical protein